MQIIRVLLSVTLLRERERENFNAMEKSKALSRFCKLSHFKKTVKSCTDKVQEKVPSFQKGKLYCVI